MNFSFIFIASTHGFVNDFLKQKEIITSIQPEFVLSEDLEAVKLNSDLKFKKFFKKKVISNMTSYKDVKNLAKLCFDKKINLIGIDFHNFGFDKNLQRKIKNEAKLTIKEEKELNNLIKKREVYHLQKILEYKNKTSHPLIIILGAWHLREKSLLREKLNNYKIITPCDEKGNILLGPKKEMEIKYKEIISNGC